MHDKLYKRGYSDQVGIILRKLYEGGKIKSLKEFEEVLANVLSIDIRIEEIRMCSITN